MGSFLQAPVPGSYIYLTADTSGALRSWAIRAGQTAPGVVLTSPAGCYSDAVIVEFCQSQAVDVTPDTPRIFHFYIRIYCRLTITLVDVVLLLGNGFACDYFWVSISSEAPLVAPPMGVHEDIPGPHQRISRIIFKTDHIDHYMVNK